MDDDEIIKQWQDIVNESALLMFKGKPTLTLEQATIKLYRMAEERATDKFCESLNARVKQEDIIREQARASEREKIILWCEQMALAHYGEDKNDGVGKGQNWAFNKVIKHLKKED